MLIIIKNIYFLYGTIIRNYRTGHRWEGEKERLRETEERDRDKVWLRKVEALVVKMTIEENT